MLGADGRCTQDDQIVTDEDVKVRTYGTCVVATAGIDVLRHLRRAQSWAQVTARARAAALDAGEWELLGYDSTREMLLTLDSSCEISVAHMYAIGSGAPFAFGALYVLGAPKTLEDAAKHCRKALCAATARSVHCGGKLRIVTYHKSV